MRKHLSLYLADTRSPPIRGTGIDSARVHEKFRHEPLPPSMLYRGCSQPEPSPYRPPTLCRVLADLSQAKYLRLHQRRNNSHRSVDVPGIPQRSISASSTTDPQNAPNYRPAPVPRRWRAYPSTPFGPSGSNCAPNLPQGYPFSSWFYLSTGQSPASRQ